MNSNKEKIIDMFYERHLSPSVVANSLNVSKAYVTKVINKDSRYNCEKLQRRKNNKIKRNEKSKIYMRIRLMSSF